MCGGVRLATCASNFSAIHLLVMTARDAVSALLGAGAATVAAVAIVRSKSGRTLLSGEDATDGVEERVKELISGCENGVVMFAKSYCPFCRRSKALLDSLGIAYCAIELDLTSDGAAIQAALLRLTGQKTVPNIFIKGTHLGGNDDLHAAHSSGALAKMLA